MRIGDILAKNGRAREILRVLVAKNPNDKIPPLVVWRNPKSPRKRRFTCTAEAFHVWARDATLIATKFKDEVSP